MFVALLISNIGLREIQEMNNIFDNLTIKKKRERYFKCYEHTKCQPAQLLGSWQK